MGTLSGYEVGVSKNNKRSMYFKKERERETAISTVGQTVSYV